MTDIATESPFRSRTRGAPAYLIAGLLGTLALVGFTTNAAADSPTTGNFNLKFGPYYPSIDEEFDGNTSPFEASFGSNARVLGQISGEYYLWQGHGKFGVGAQAGYTNFTGTSEIQGGGGGDGSDGGDGGGSSDEGVTIEEETKFRVFPLGDIATYRWDHPVEEWNIPLAAKVEGGFDYYIWRVKDGGGDISRADGTKAAGGVPGFHLAGRLEFLLNIIDPETAASFDMNWGINRTYLFAEYNYSNIRGFGGDHFRLGDSTWKAGLAFEF